MRNMLLVLAALAGIAGCHHRAGSHVSGGVLGRVVIYRNGVAFYERNATVQDGRIVVRVPRDRVDDFLKSLTVVDRSSNKPLSVTIPRDQAADGNYLTMTLETPVARHAQVMLTYVTEAPAWKPSYRVVIGTQGKVMLEAWAVVDNTTSEDWNKVLVGVGASSALAFRYDLWSVRQIDRDLLAGEDRFAIAPPTGVSPYAEAGEEEVVALGGTTPTTGRSFTSTIGMAAGVDTTGMSLQGQIKDKKSGENLIGLTVVATSPALQGEQVAITDEQGKYALTVPPGTYTLTFYYDNSTYSRSGIVVRKDRPLFLTQKIDLSASTSKGEVITITAQAPQIDTASASIKLPGHVNDRGSVPFETKPGYYPDDTRNAPAVKPTDPIKTLVERFQQDKRDVLIEVHGAAGSDKAALARGEVMKSKLVDGGLPAKRIRVVPKLGEGKPESVRVIAVAPGEKPEATPPKQIAPGDTPVGESHFMADRPMTVKAGSSAMVAMLHGETTGGVVYLYDPISERGDKRFAFKAVRLDNPTGDTLEPGPVTVYGDGRFIGEGITEPVPPHASVVVPFALDKQVVVERHTSEQDRIAKLVTVQRGVITAELQHRRESKFSITSRLPTPTRVFVRHQLESGWALVESPSTFTKVGDSQLFEISLAPLETKLVTISEATPVERTFDLQAPDAMAMMQVFIDEPAASPELKAQITAILATHRVAADLTDKIATLREQLGEYRARSGELNAQIVSLRKVRSGGELMAALRTRLGEMADRTQKATIAIVDTQEKLMLARVKFQNQLADLKLTDQTTAKKSVSTR
ncbi:MAG: carboxypeptidase regulatory-like domain-containing protein [Kofleriaceae bacterium]